MSGQYQDYKTNVITNYVQLVCSKSRINCHNSNIYSWRDAAVKYTLLT